jgi:hypothetical protein
MSGKLTPQPNRSDPQPDDSDNLLLQIADWTDYRADWAIHVLKMESILSNMGQDHPDYTDALDFKIFCDRQFTAYNNALKAAELSLKSSGSE